MKRLLPFLSIFFISTGLLAQSKTIKDFQKKYKEDLEVTSITIDGKLINLVGAIAAFAEEDEDAQAFARIANNIKFMDILTVPMHGTGLSREEIASMKKKLKRDAYDELMQVRDGTQKINFMADAHENRLRNMVVMIEDKDEFVMMNISGTLNMKDLSKLVQHRKKWGKKHHE